MRYLLVSVLLVALCSSAASAEPSLGDAQSAFSAGEYRPCLAKIAQVFAMKSPAPTPQTRYELFKLRGECLLQLKSAQVAADAFHSAALIVKQDGSMQDYASAEAVAILIKASPGLRYTPKKSRDAKPID